MALKRLSVYALIVAAITGIALSASGAGSVNSRKDSAKSVAQVSWQPVVSRADLPGTFYQGDGLGVNLYLTLKDDGRFTFVWRGCLGEYDRNEGPWHIEGDCVVFEPEKLNKREGFLGMDTRFVPFKWGERIYLIDEYEAPGFAASMRKNPQGADVRRSDYIKMDEKSHPIKASGKLSVPERFKQYYEQGAIEAKIVSLNKDGTVTLDQGSEGRLVPKMRLVTKKFWDTEFEVLSVRSQSSIARPWYYINYNPKEKAKVGDTLTTGIDSYRPRGTGTKRYASPPASE